MFNLDLGSLFKRPFSFVKAQEEEPKTTLKPKLKPEHLISRRSKHPAKFTAMDHLKGYEKLRLKAYMPTENDVPTIGWGHTGSDVQMGMRITKSRADQLLRDDIQWAVDAVRKLVKVRLSQGQFNALVSFVFNIGRSAFRSSTLLRLLNQERFDEAADEFQKWKYQDGEVLRGLVRRRRSERAMFEGKESA